MVKKVALHSDRNVTNVVIVQSFPGLFVQANVADSYEILSRSLFMRVLFPVARAIALSAVSGLKSSFFGCGHTGQLLMPRKSIVKPDVSR